MNKSIQLSFKILKVTIIATLPIIIFSCKQDPQKVNKLSKLKKTEYFLLRPKLEKMYGYTQAVKVGNIVKVGGVISIDETGNPIAKEDYVLQMKNCYSSLEKILKHYGCTFDDVILENIYTTDIAKLQKNASYRQEIYKKNFPTGSWIGVKELGLPEIMIEIEIEAVVPLD